MSPVEVGKTRIMGWHLFPPPLRESRSSSLLNRNDSRNARAGPVQENPQVDHAITTPLAHTSNVTPTAQTEDNSNSLHTPDLKVTVGFPQREQPMIRSMFPCYDPNIALEHQAYYPTVNSPTHIPTAILNRPEYSPSIKIRRKSGLQSPMAMGASPGRFPRGIQEETILKPSENDELKHLWKVVNGWRLSASEGRKFSLKMTSSPEEPLHILSSSTQAFYSLKLVPTSTSAQMTFTRHDPNKSTGSPKPGSLKMAKGIEVMKIALEEKARRFRPNDGLVALLYPKAASDVVVDLVNQIPACAESDQVITAAERECARLVWDEDAERYYLVHPAMTTPFIVSISSSPAWSTAEYLLEHAEMPRNLVRLVRDCTGSGYLETDTSVAAGIDSFYIIDVAICAIMLVALEEEKMKNIERFHAPPSIVSLSCESQGSRRDSGRLIWAWSKPQLKRDKRNRLIEMEVERLDMDLENQSSVKNGNKPIVNDEKVTGFCGLIWILVRCLVETLKAFMKLMAKFIICISARLTQSGPM